MKKLITTTAIVFCIINANAQLNKPVKTVTYDTVEFVHYDSLGNEYHYSPKQYVYVRTEVINQAYADREKRRYHRWNKISLGIFAIGTVIGFIATAK